MNKRIKTSSSKAIPSIPELNTAIAECAMMDEAAYQRRRKSKAKELGISVLCLDEERQKATVKSETRQDDVPEADERFSHLKPAIRSFASVLSEWGFGVRYNEFAEHIEINGAPVSDDVVTNIRACFKGSDGKPRLYSKDAAYDCLLAIAKAEGNTYHPVRDYLNGLAWDGVDRLPTWIEKYIVGIELNNPKLKAYYEAIGTCTMIGAVARIFTPGFKHDTMLVLEGDQGKTKSQVVATIAIKDEWFSDNLPSNLESKDATMQLFGTWHVEMAELSAIRHGKVEAAKQFISRRIDKVRLPYGRTVVSYPRQTICWGTVNKDEYLKDETGNRRFWPVRCYEIDRDGLKEAMDQLYAEAVVRFRRGEKNYLTPALEKSAAEIVQERLEVTSLHPKIVAFAESGGVSQTLFTVSEVWEAIGGRDETITKRHEQEIGQSLRMLGLKKERLRFGGTSAIWVWGTEEALKRRKRYDPKTDQPV